MIVERAYKAYTWDAALDSAVQRLDAGETLDFGAIRVTKDYLYVHGLVCIEIINDTYRIVREVDVTLVWNTIVTMNDEDITWADEEDVSSRVILIRLQPDNDPELLLVPFDYVSNAPVLLVLAELFVDRRGTI